jgi:ribosomal-protein-alanine N-acetyltransferase
MAILPEAVAAAPFSHRRQGSGMISRSPFAAAYPRGNAFRTATMGAPLLATERLRLRELTAADAPFMLELVNDPGWIRFIGDRGVRDLAGARRYLERGPLRLYARLGFGLWHVGTARGDESLGICGLIKRESLEDVDLGYAFLPRFRGQGFAFEAAAASRDYGVGELGLQRIVAITSPGNAISARLLERLGFAWEGTVGPEDDPVRLYGFNP